MAPLFWLGAARDKWGQFLWLGAPGLWNSTELSELSELSAYTIPQKRGGAHAAGRLSGSTRGAHGGREMLGCGEGRCRGQRRQGNAVELLYGQAYPVLMRHDVREACRRARVRKLEAPEARLALVKREAKHGKAIGRLLFEGARCFHPYLRLMTGFKLER
jgi:hypothetical protein